MSRLLPIFLTANMTPAERVAHRTWSTLFLAQDLRTRFGEETLTDLLMLDMLADRHARGFSLYQTTKHEEHRWGADLFVLIRYPTGRWSRLAVQAKKLCPDDRYQMLYRVTESRKQLGKLEQFARQNHALPLYLLYNHSEIAECSDHWHCQLPFDKRQLGCTLVPSWHIRRVLRRLPRGFDSAHNVSQSRPWRCVFDCPFAEGELIQMAYRSPHPDSDTPPEYDWPFRPMEDGWPEWLFETSRTQLTGKDMDRIRGELSGLKRPVADDMELDAKGSDEVPLNPARLLAFDWSSRTVSVDGAE